MSRRQDLGDATELLVADRLRENGMGVKRLFLGGCDLITDVGIRIEVKASCKNRDGWFRATVNDRWQRATDHSDLVVFVAWEREQAHVFAIPTDRISSKRIAIRLTGTNKWAGYRVSWEQLARIFG